ncbi:MAG: histidinol-phosphatase [Bacteroidales bacterium]|nr:histidinol-phosphatase [Bacteroidales bacterium]
MKYCYHTHTNFCDGDKEPEEYVLKAMELGFFALGFSGHAPVPLENNFAIPENRLDEYCVEIRRLKALYKHKINILLGLEIDYIPGITYSFQMFRERCSLDYDIGSVHLVRNPENGKLWFIDGPHTEIYDEGLLSVFHGDIQKAVKSYFAQINDMIMLEKPQIIGHLDKIRMHNADRYFSEQEIWYQELLTQTLDNIKESGAVVEINTRGKYKKRSDTFFPSSLAFSMMSEMAIPVMIGTDAHKVEELSLEFQQALLLLKNAGYVADDSGLFVIHRKR